LQLAPASPPPALASLLPPPRAPVPGRLACFCKINFRKKGRLGKTRREVASARAPAKCVHRRGLFPTAISTRRNFSLSLSLSLSLSRSWPLLYTSLHFRRINKRRFPRILRALFTYGPSFPSPFLPCLLWHWPGSKSTIVFYNSPELRTSYCQKVQLNV
jgi:hypothetical protein